MSKIAVIGIADESVFLSVDTLSKRNYYASAINVGRKYILDAIPTKKEIENIGKKYE